MIKLVFVFIYVMFASMLHASFDTKEVVTVNETTIEITRNCQLYVTHKDGKRKFVPFALDKFKSCSIMEYLENLPLVVEIPAYGDTLFTIQSIEHKDTSVNFEGTSTRNIKRYIVLLVTKEEGKVYFSKLYQSAYRVAAEKWQLRIESYRIRKLHNLDYKLLEVKHKYIAPPP